MATYFSIVLWVIQLYQLCDPMDYSPPSSSGLWRGFGIFQARNTGVSCHFLLQGIFPTQGSNLHLLCLLHCRQILHPLGIHAQETPWTQEPGVLQSMESHRVEQDWVTNTFTFIQGPWDQVCVHSSSACLTLLPPPASNLNVLFPTERQRN